MEHKNIIAQKVKISKMKVRRLPDALLVFYTFDASCLLRIGSSLLCSQ